MKTVLTALTPILILILTFIITFPATSDELDKDKSEGPSWLLTIPTAETIERKDYNLGLIQGGTIPFHADVAELWNHFEMGIHGVKYQLLHEKDAWISLAAGATFGFYPSGAYLVGSKSLNNLRAHIGVRFLPFDKAQDEAQDQNQNMTRNGNDYMDNMYNMSGTSNNMVSNGNDGSGKTQPLRVFFGVDKQVQEKIKLMLEVADALNGGFRVKLHPNWNIDVGVRVGFPERFKVKLGKRNYAIGYTSEGVQPYLGLVYSSRM